MTHRRTFPRPWLLAASLLLLMTGGCEKDDICPEGTLTTPRAKVLFYAFDDADKPKNTRKRDFTSTDCKAPNA